MSQSPRDKKLLYLNKYLIGYLKNQEGRAPGRIELCEKLLLITK